MDKLSNGHYYIMIVQGVSQGGGVVYYDVKTKEIIYGEDYGTIKQKFLSKVTCLIDYIVSTKETMYDFSDFFNILVNIKFLCRHKNMDSDDPTEMIFGFPSGTLCYDDDDDDDDDSNEHVFNVSDHINRMENSFLQCDNTDVFIVGKQIWPLI